MGHRTILCSYCNHQLSIKKPSKDQQLTCPVCDRTTQYKGLPSDVEELAMYSLQEPFSFVSIIKETESLKKQYLVLEPQLIEEDRKVLDFIRETLIKTLNVRLDTLEKDAEQFLIEAVNNVLITYEIKLDFVTYQKILYFLKQRFLGFDAIDPLMKDATIEDISCDGAKTPLFVYQREFGSLETNVVFNDEDSLANFVIKLAQKCGKHISVSDPMLDATMPDGSRIQMTLRGEVTTRGSTFTIRKFRADPITPVDLVNYNTFSLKMMAYLWMAVEHGYNALISGGTASGKTSTLNALSLFIPKESKIVSIEETREINLPHPNWIPGVTRSGFGEVVNDRVVGEIDLFDLMKAALRQRPEYILVGEIRGKEAYVLFQAMATGHTTYSTVHADTTQALIHRLEGKPINIPRTMLQSLDIVLLMRTQKTQNQQQRRCVKIVELLNVDSETNEVLTNTVFEWNPKEQLFEYSGKSFVLEQIHTIMDMNVEEMSAEIKNRARIIDWMKNYHLREFTDVAHILAQYAETPNDVLDLIEKPPEQIKKEIKESLSIEQKDVNSILELPQQDYQKIIEKLSENKGALTKINSLFSSKSKKKEKKSDKKTKKSSLFYNTLHEKNESFKAKSESNIPNERYEGQSKTEETKPSIHTSPLVNKKPASYFSRQKTIEKKAQETEEEIDNFFQPTTKKPTETHRKRANTKQKKNKKGMKIPKVRIRIKKDKSNKKANGEK